MSKSLPSDALIQSVILSHDEEITFLRKHQKGQKVFNHIFKIEKNGKTLIYVGVNHTYDLTHPQFQIMLDLWRDFLSTGKKEMKRVLVESRAKRIFSDQEEAITKGGETALMRYLSTKEGIPFDCPEPTQEEQIRYLQEFYDDEQIFYFYFSRQIGQRTRKPLEKRIDIKTYLQSKFEEFQGLKIRRTLQEISFDTFAALHVHYFGEQPRFEDDAFWSELSDPFQYTTFTNDVARSLHGIREITIVKYILADWNEGYDLFIVYGCSHAIRQQPALERFCV